MAVYLPPSCVSKEASTAIVTGAAARTTKHARPSTALVDVVRLQDVPAALLPAVTSNTVRNNFKYGPL